MIELRRPAGARPLVFGHRGSPEDAPENTMQSFRAAVAAGADGVEIDVLQLPGGQLVAAHDLSAATGETEPPAFADVLAFFASQARETLLQLDMKTVADPRLLASTVREHGLTDRVLVTSPRRGDLRAVSAERGGLAVALGYPEDRLRVSHRRSGSLLVPVALRALRTTAPVRIPRLTQAGDAAIALQHRLVTPSLVSGLHSRGLAVLAWTVDAPADVERAVAAGVDVLITNRPVAVLATLLSTP